MRGAHSTGPRPRVLLLAGAGLGWPERRDLERLVGADEMPDVLTLHLHATPVDEAYLEACPGLVGRFLRSLPFPLAQALVAVRDRRDYDVVLTWSEPATCLLAALVAAGRLDLPHVSVHSWISKPKKAVPLKLVHRGITTMIVPPPTQREFALTKLGLPPAKLPSVRWGVDLRFWRPSDRSTDMICCVGREMRDYATLVESVRQTAIPCHIAAGGLRAVSNPWLAGLSAELPANVTIGGKRGIELRELYARSRFTVVPLHPSDTDNGITAILESFAMGKPVICTATPGQIGVVQDGVNGLLVPPGSPEAMRAAILRLWRDPDECERMGRNGRRLVEEQHNYEQWVSALTEGLDDDDHRSCAGDAGARRSALPRRGTR